MPRSRSAEPEERAAIAAMGAAVQRGRKALGMGLREFAALTNTNFTSISRFERGHDVKLSTALQIIRTLTGWRGRWEPAIGMEH